MTNNEMRATLTLLGWLPYTTFAGSYVLLNETIDRVYFLSDDHTYHVSSLTHGAAATTKQLFPHAVEWHWRYDDWIELMYRAAMRCYDEP